MPKLKEVYEMYGDYEVDIDELMKILKKPEPRNIWNLKNGEKYFYITANGDILIAKWHDDFYNINRLQIGNVYLTEEDARFEKYKMIVESRIIRYGGSKYRDDSSYKFFLFYDDVKDEVYVKEYQSRENNYGERFFFKNKVDCQEAIDNIGQHDLKRFIFNVR